MKDLALFNTEPLVVGDPNPCVGLFGKGPEGKRCKTCLSLRQYGLHRSKRWYKCLLRRDPRNPDKLGGPKTDHRVRWNACAKYTEEEAY